MAAENDARQTFQAALLDDPMVRTYVAYRWHRYRRAALRREAQNAAYILNEAQTAERIVDLNEWGPTMLEDIASSADAEARRLAAEDSQAVFDQLNDPETL